MASRRPGLTVTGQIEIPSIGLVATTFEGNTLPTIDHGPSHWPGTAMPGELGNSVFAGHRVTHTHPFLDLDLVKPGDSVVFTTAAGRFAYVVDETIIVTPDQLWIVNPTPGATTDVVRLPPEAPEDAPHRGARPPRRRRTATAGPAPHSGHAAPTPPGNPHRPSAPSSTTTTTTAARVEQSLQRRRLPAALTAHSVGQRHARLGG